VDTCWIELRRAVLGIRPDEVLFAKRGFGGTDLVAREVLEGIGTSFLCGYNAAIEESNQGALEKRLTKIDCDLRGFAFEGAAMGLLLLDHLLPKMSNRFSQFVLGPGERHIYMVHIGAGWALARIPWTRRRIEKSIQKLSPMLRMLAIDGYGFHEGYFNFRKWIDKKVVPSFLSLQALRAFDQGLGRSLWFVKGADECEIAKTVEEFESSRRPDLWSGVGLACAYAGGVSEPSIKTLRKLGDKYIPQLAQGAAFAAKARSRAGNAARCTEAACRILCRTSAIEAAAVTDAALNGLIQEGHESQFAAWQRQVQTIFAKA